MRPSGEGPKESQPDNVQAAAQRRTRRFVDERNSGDALACEPMIGCTGFTHRAFSLQICTPTLEATTPTRHTEGSSPSTFAEHLDRTAGSWIRNHAAERGVVGQAVPRSGSLVQSANLSTMYSGGTALFTGSLPGLVQRTTHGLTSAIGLLLIISTVPAADFHI